MKPEGGFQGLDIVGTHVTDSGNNPQSSILTVIKTLIQNLHNHLCLSAFLAKVVSYWLLPLSTQATEMKTGV
jgi:hypothetical protein